MGLYRAYTGITGIIWGVYRVRIWDCIGLILGLRGLNGGSTGLEYGIGKGLHWDYGDYMGGIQG